MPPSVEAETRTPAMRVLLELEEATKSCDGQLECVIEQDNWSLGRKLYVTTVHLYFKKFNAHLPSFNQELPSSEILDAATISQAANDRYRLEYIVKLSSALATSASELLKLYDRRLNPIVSKMSKGLASLPDELIGLILTFAAHHEEERPGYVGSLSQVSCRFHRIVLGHCDLWSTLLMHHNTKIAYVKRCIRRSGDITGIHLIINDNVSVQVPTVDAFIGVCSSVASRWRTVTLFGDWKKDWDTNNNYTLGGTMNKLLRNRLTLPCLHELSLIQSQFINFDGEHTWFQSEDIQDGTSWVTPNLRVLRCTQYIPPPSFPFNSIALFSLDLTLVPYNISDQMGELVGFLSSMTNISEISLGFTSLNNWNVITDLALHRDGPGSFHPAVTTFRLHLRGFDSPYYAQMMLGPFMDSLQMPNIKHLFSAL